MNIINKFNPVIKKNYLYELVDSDSSIIIQALEDNKINHSFCGRVILSDYDSYNPGYTSYGWDLDSHSWEEIGPLEDNNVDNTNTIDNELNQNNRESTDD